MDAKNKGGPRGVWIDNGKDYDAWLFHGQTKQQRRETIKPRVEEAGTLGIFAALKIDAHFATPYNPNGKARLERWFRTLETFARTFETYTGDGIDTKPERLSEILEKPRSIPTFADVQKRMADHIAGNNLRTDHDVDDLIDAGERLSPDEAMSRWNDRTRVWADPKALDVLLMHWHQPVTVGRNGIKIGLGGLRMGYGSTSPELARFKAAKRSQRKPVLVAFDPHDLRTIRVFDEQFRYVCTAPMNRLGGMHGDKIDRELVADLNRDKARYERSQKHVAEYSITSVLTNEENLAHMAAKRGAERDRQRAAATPTAPASMQMVQTPLDGQAVEIEREEMRAAVGAESPASRRRVNPLDLLNMIRARDEAARNQPAKDRGHHADDADAAAPAAAPNHDDADDADDDATASVGVGVAADSYARLRRTYGRD
jgi:hypothetical protein